MTRPGQRTAKPPVSPHANLTAVERAGTTRHGSAIWRVECNCGHSLQADAPTIKRGAAHCPECNPTYGDLEAHRILAALPGTIDEIVERTSMGLGAVKYRLSLMKPHLCHVGKWRRPRGSGAHQPVIVAGMKITKLKMSSRQHFDVIKEELMTWSMTFRNCHQKL